MFCPECGSEYVAGVDVCADCGSALVPELPASPPPEFVHYVAILATPNPAEIAVIKSILAEAGIPFRFFSETAGPPLTLPATLLVPEDRAAEAKDVLAEIVEPGEAADRGEGDGQGG